MAAKKKTAKTPKISLHAVLTKAFPDHLTVKHQVLDIEWLAKKLKITSEAIYTWFRDDKIPFARATAVCKIAGCQIELDVLLPYCK